MRLSWLCATSNQQLTSNAERRTDSRPVPVDVTTHWAERAGHNAMS